MGIARGPDIITKDLKFSIDAADERSYPGSGTVAFNLVGTNNGTLTNGVGFNNTNYGVWEFDGTDDYINLPTISVQSNLGSIECVLTRESTTTNAFVFGVVGASTNRYYLRQAGTNSLDAVRGNPLKSASFGTLDSGKFYHLIMTWNSSTIFAYTNGVLQDSESYTNPGTDITSGEIGKGPGNYMEMKLPVFRLYDVTLTSTQVLQNYNALKNRFGL